MFLVLIWFQRVAFNAVKHAFIGWQWKQFAGRIKIINLWPQPTYQNRQASICSRSVISFLGNACIFLRIHLETNKIGIKRRGWTSKLLLLFSRIRKTKTRCIFDSAMTKFYGDVIQWRIHGDRIWGWNEFWDLAAES